MSGKRQLLRGGMVLSAGSALSQVLSLVRNLAVARLVSPDQFGIAVTFALTLSMLEAAFAHGFDKLLVQDEDGEKEPLQSMLHAVLVVRGLFIGAMLFVAAPWIALAFDVPEATLAYQLLALVPVARGLMHMDVKRIQRKMLFAPDILSRLISQAVGVAVAIGYAWVFRDYWGMLWGVLSQTILLTLLTHYYAERRYQVGWTQFYAQRVIRFSVPLMINGLIMILSDQATRILVGARLSVSQLAIFSAAIMPLEAGLAFLAQVFGDLSVPWLASARSEPDLFRQRHSLLGTAICVTTVAVFAPFALIGVEVTRLIFGPDYIGATEIFAWLALAFGLRFLRVWPIATAISLGDTRNLMISNLARSSGIVVAVVLIEAGLGLTGAAMATAVAEGLATVVAFIRLRKTGGDMLAPGRRYLSFALAGFALATCIAVLIDTPLYRIGFALALTPLALIASVLLEPGFLKTLWRLLRAR